MSDFHPDNYGSPAREGFALPASPLHASYLLRNYAGQIMTEMITGGKFIATPQPALAAVLADVDTAVIDRFKAAINETLQETINAHEKIRQAANTPPPTRPPA